jgi:hypothetical protein
MFKALALHVALGVTCTAACGPASDDAEHESGIIEFDDGQLRDPREDAASLGGAGGSPGGVSSGGGTSSPGGRCSGAATPCSLLPDSQCYGALGCSVEGECTGYSTSCFSLFYSSACISQRGCVWSSYNDSCSGSAWSCSLQSGSSSCIGQRGCSWQDSCDGFVESCASLSEVYCDNQPGCAWVE